VEVAVRLKSTRDIRYYLYLSTAKLDMLYEQVFRESKRSGRSLSLPTGIGSAEISSESDGTPDRDDKIRALEQELEERGLIGDLNEPRDYIRGILPMRWGLFDDNGTRGEGEPALVYFGGFDPADGPLLVGLGGSSVHVIGYQGASSTHSRSNTPALVRWMMSGLGDEQPVSLSEDPRVEEQVVMSAIAVAHQSLRPPTQNLEFLARTLLTGTLLGYEQYTGSPRSRVILGTPLYVVQSHPLPDENRWGLDWSDVKETERLRAEGFEALQRELGIDHEPH
jgi:hypothetical protein